MKPQGHPRFYELIEEIKQLHAAKNHDYTKGRDALSNLRACESFGVPAWKGTLVRMCDKWSRLQSFALCDKLKVENEKITDTLMDFAVYSLLEIILIEEAQEAKSCQKST